MDVLNGPYSYFLATRLRARQILKFLNPLKNDILLDAGCGIGYFSILLKQRNLRAIGIDIDFTSLQMAQSSNEVKFLCADLRKLPFKDNTFNKILASEILEHLPKEEEALKELRRVCISGCELIFTAPSTEGLLSFTPLRLLGHKKPGVEFHYRYGYTKNELKELISRCGFFVEKLTYCTGIISESFIQLLKLAYFLKKRDFSRQADFFAVKNTLLFKFYKKVILPLMYAIGIFEDEVLNKFLKGHILVVKAVVQKSDF